MSAGATRNAIPVGLVHDVLADGQLHTAGELQHRPSTVARLTEDTDDFERRPLRGTAEGSVVGVDACEQGREYGTTNMR